MVPGDLCGATITAAELVGDELRLMITLADGRDALASVLSDPEGNRSGALHLRDNGSREYHILGG
jgi:hypothetical protein